MNKMIQNCKMYDFIDITSTLFLFVLGMSVKCRNAYCQLNVATPVFLGVKEKGGKEQSIK